METKKGGDVVVIYLSPSSKTTHNLCVSSIFFLINHSNTKQLKQQIPNDASETIYDAYE